MKCEACERGDHDNCGMQTWCSCDCEGYGAGVYIPDDFYFKDDLDGGRLVPKTVEGSAPPNAGGASPATGNLLTNGPMICANCGEESTNPGQFVRDDRWVCTNACRKELIEKDSYRDLADSGGIVDAP